MKVVLDSNVVIAAFATRGICDLIFEYCLTEHRIILSEFILKEVKANLRKKLRLPKANIKEIISFLKSNCDIYSPPKLDIRICRDPDDDQILSLAYFSNAEFMITGDKDLLDLGSFKNIPILTPRDFAEKMKKYSSSTHKR